MKKIAFLMSVLLLYGGLFCIHLVAQSERRGNVPASAETTSLIVPNIAERSERELLERKVEARRTIVELVTLHSEMGSPRGRAFQLMGARAGLAAAEIELYRHTGEQEKLLAAHQAKVEAMTHKVQSARNAYESDAITLEELLESEIQLLDALLEQKREPTR